MIVVLDSNVLLAALGFPGVCRTLTRRCLKNQSVVLSEHILTELSRHLRTKGRLSPGEAERRLRELRNGLPIVGPASVPADACRDAEDLPILGTALAAGADRLVTGDKDLLDLQTFHDCRILSPRQFLDELEGDAS